MIAIGDIAERCLRFFGITKTRVQALTGGKDCGCAQRQAAMNRAGYTVQAAAYRLLRQSWRLAWHGSRMRKARHYQWLALRALFYGR